MRFTRMLTLLALAIALISLSAARSARADQFDVSLNTSSLSGTQILAFGFTDGDGVADNSATLSNFDFGGGSATGSPSYVGPGASGSLTSSVVVNDTDFSSLFYQDFIAGSSLSFLLNITNAFAGGTPDNLAMYVCAADFSECYSDDYSSSADLSLNILGTALTPSSFTLNPATLQNLPAPVVTTATSNVPEPGTLVLIALGATALLALRRIG